MLNSFSYAVLLVNYNGSKLIESYKLQEIFLIRDPLSCDKLPTYLWTDLIKLDLLVGLARARLSQSGAQVLLQFGAPFPGYRLKKRGEVYYEIDICFCL